MEINANEITGVLNLPSGGDIVWGIETLARHTELLGAVEQYFLQAKDLADEQSGVLTTVRMLPRDLFVTVQVAICAATQQEAEQTTQFIHPNVTCNLLERYPSLRLALIDVVYEICQEIALPRGRGTGDVTFAIEQAVALYLDTGRIPEVSDIPTTDIHIDFNAEAPTYPRLVFSRTPRSIDISRKLRDHGLFQQAVREVGVDFEGRFREIAPPIITGLAREEIIIIPYLIGSQNEDPLTTLANINLILDITRHLEGISQQATAVSPETYYFALITSMRLRFELALVTEHWRVGEIALLDPNEDMFLALNPEEQLEFLAMINQIRLLLVAKEVQPFIYIPIANPHDNDRRIQYVSQNVHLWLARIERTGQHTELVPLMLPIARLVEQDLRNVVIAELDPYRDFRTRDIEHEPGEFPEMLQQLKDTRAIIRKGAERTNVTRQDIRGWEKQLAGFGFDPQIFRDFKPVKGGRTAYATAHQLRELLLHLERQMDYWFDEEVDRRAEAHIASVTHID